MPRPKVVERRRCVKACESCKKRKEKCDGLKPCANCKKRKREDACSYQIRAPSTTFKSPTTIPFERHEPVSGNIDEPSIIGSPPDISGNINGTDELVDSDVLASATSAPVPQLSSLLRDPREKFSMCSDIESQLWLTNYEVYLGDSASLSFLQTIRRIVEKSIGPSNFTTDKFRHTLIEQSTRIQDVRIDNDESALELRNVVDLTRQFFLACSGALDLFDSSFTLEQIQIWVQDPKRSQWPSRSIFYLVLAIGAQARACGHTDDHAAEHYFGLGRRYATTDLVEDPSILTVQAFSLITWYMVTACRRNGASMNLGFAVQAAYSLGIHRHEANVVFGKEVAISRKRAWKTLRVCDLFLSASMGRPSTTSNIDCNIPCRRHLRPDNEEHAEEYLRLDSAMTRICIIFERILSEVYTKRAVSLELARSISAQHREWTTELPEMLRVDGLSRPDKRRAADLTRILGSAIVVMAYYYSIILLTRPFLTFRVSSYIKTRSPWPEFPSESPDVTTYSDACVDSAIKGIDIAHSVALINGMPKRLPLIINSVFISALTLGLAYFGDYDLRGWALETGISQAITVLGHFGPYNPQSARYKQIVEYLRDAAAQYKEQRDNLLLHERTQQVRNVFGNVSPELNNENTSVMQPEPFYSSNTISSLSTRGTEQPKGQTTSAGSRIPTVQDFEMVQQSSMITTSGTLAPQPGDQDGRDGMQYSAADEDFENFFNALSPPSSSFSFGDEVPLFSMYQLPQDVATPFG
jgi:hypothetical protein